MNRRVAIFLLGIFVAVGYALYRSISPYLLWDDTNWIHINAPAAGFLHPATWIERLHHYFIEPFAQVSYNGYRPLNSIIRLIGIDFFLAPGMCPQVWFAAVAILEGVGAVIIFTFLRRMLRTDIFALGVLFVFLASTPIVSSYWIVFTAVHILVPAIICLGLELYFRIREDQRCSNGFKAVFLIILFFGSWYREFIGILPLLIIALEVINKRKITRILLVAGLAFLQALFPTALMKIFFHDLPLSPVYKIGLLGERMAGMNASWDLFSVVYNGFNLILNFYSLIPPLLWIMVLVALAFLCMNRESRTDIFNKRFSFLLIWFLISFLPFIKIYTEQVHLAYCLLPALLIIGIIVEQVFLKLHQGGRLRKVSRFLLVALLGIILTDYGANLYGSAKVVYEINQGMHRVAKEMKERLPTGSIVIGNALHVGDIQTYAQNYFTTYYSVRAGVPWPKYVIFEKADLQRFVQEQGRGKDIYFLSVDFKYTRDKVGYHRHKFVYDDTITKEYLGKIDQVVARYPYFDPLKSSTPRSFISFLGPPDLENDFYRGPCQDGAPFCREVSAEYHLYKYLPSEN